jgi:hypothetical protein
MKKMMKDEDDVEKRLQQNYLLGVPMTVVIGTSQMPVPT